MPPLERSRILLLIPHLGGGGAERVIEALAGHLSPRKYEVHLALMTQSRHSAPSLPACITMHELRARRVRNSALKLLLLTWHLRPRLILSGIAHLNLLVLLLRPLLPRTTRIIVRQNGALRATLGAHAHQALARHAYRLAYRRADAIICQTDSMLQELNRELQVAPAHLDILPNPIDIHRIRTSVTSLRSNPLAAPNSYLLAAGRLVPEKGFDLLLVAFASLPDRFSETELVIAGTGPEMASLQQQAATLKVEHRVRFVGHTPDPIIRFNGALLFVLSSRTEGLPNVVLEAAAARLPIVSTPASPGLVDLLQNRHGVWLATDIAADALRCTLEQALTSIRPGQRFAHPWIEPYDLTRAIPAYEAAIDRILAGSAR